MYFMGSEEFKQYLYSEERLKELISAQELHTRRAYNDIHPTRMGYDREMGSMYSESINVADYAIWLVELKEKQQEMRGKMVERVQLLHRVLDELPGEEVDVLRRHIENCQGLNQALLYRAMKHLKDRLESLLSSNHSASNQSVQRAVHIDRTAGRGEVDEAGGMV